MKYRTITLVMALGIVFLSTIAIGQSAAGRGPKGRGPRADAEFVADRAVFQQLLRHRDAICREVKFTESGVETLTESEDPKVAALIREHVAAMKKRVEENRPIHRRDELFAELFRHADKITFAYESTEKGVRVTESATDPHVVALIQRHAQVVSLFLENGPEEVHRNHAVPTPTKESGP